MVAYDVRQRVHEPGTVVERGRALVMADAHPVRHLAVFAIQLRECLDVIAGEGDRHHQQVLLPAGAEALDHPLGARPEPADGAHFALEGEEVGVGAAEPLHDRLDARPDLLRIGVAPIDDVERQRVRAEQEQDLVPHGGVELREPFAHRVGHRPDEPGVHRPPVDDAPLECVPQARALGGAPELVQARAGGAAGELGVLGEGDRALDAVRRHGAKRVLALGLDIAKRHVEAVRRRVRREPVEPLDHPLALRPGVPEDGRPTADLVVQAADLGGPPPRYEGAEPVLERQLDDLAVREQLEQERLDLVEVGWPAEVQHHDPGFDLAHGGSIPSGCGPGSLDRLTESGPPRGRSW